MTTQLDYEPKKSKPRISDEIAYILPMAVFMVFTIIGGKWMSIYPLTYVVKTIAVAILLAVLWPHYTKIRWNHWWLGVIVGIVGIVQWVGIEKLWPNYPKMASGKQFIPTEYFESTTMMWSFIIFRWAGATLVVPVMEELFWRDYLWRWIIAPADFKLAKVGEWELKAFIVVPLAFSTVHFQWPTAIIWGLLIGWLLVYTKSLGACIIAHGVTNFLLGAYVLLTKEWQFW